MDVPGVGSDARKGNPKNRVPSPNILPSRYLPWMISKFSCQRLV